MVAVAVLALTLGAARTAAEHRRHQKIREQRETIARQQGLMRQVEEMCFLPTDTPEMTQKQAAIVQAMEEKYRKGAAEPWVELPPDPPAPPPVVDVEQILRDIAASRERLRRTMERWDDPLQQADPGARARTPAGHGRVE